MGVQAMALGGPLRGDQAVAPFPGADGNGIDAGQCGYGSDGQQSLSGGLGQFLGGSVHGGFLLNSVQTL